MGRGDKDIGHTHPTRIEVQRHLADAQRVETAAQVQTGYECRVDARLQPFDEHLMHHIVRLTLTRPVVERGLQVVHIGQSVARCRSRNARVPQFEVHRPTQPQSPYIVVQTVLVVVHYGQCPTHRDLLRPRRVECHRYRQHQHNQHDERDENDFKQFFHENSVEFKPFSRNGESIANHSLPLYNGEGSGLGSVSLCERFLDACDDLVLQVTGIGHNVKHFVGQPDGMQFFFIHLEDVRQDGQLAPFRRTLPAFNLAVHRSVNLQCRRQLPLQHSSLFSECPYLFTEYHSLLFIYDFPIATLVRADATDYALLLKVFDVPCDIPTIYTYCIGHLLTRYIGIFLNQFQYFL